MKPIDNTTGVDRVVSTLLGKTAETLTSNLAAKLFGRPRPAKRRRARPRRAKRRRARAPRATKRPPAAAPAQEKGGETHG